MSQFVTIQIMQDKATTDGRTWQSENKTLESLLNTTCGPDRIAEYVPDLPRALADQAVQQWGAMIVEIVEDPPGKDDGFIYNSGDDGPHPEPITRGKTL